MNLALLCTAGGCYKNLRVQVVVKRSFKRKGFASRPGKICTLQHPMFHRPCCVVHEQWPAMNASMTSVVEYQYWVYKIRYTYA